MLAWIWDARTLPSARPKPGIRRIVKGLVYNNATLPLREAATIWYDAWMLLTSYVHLIAPQPLGTSSPKQDRQS